MTIVDKENEKTEQLAIRLPASLMVRLREEARLDVRTLSALVKKILLEHSPEPQAAKPHKPRVNP
jgi:hypothetical protein